MSRILICDDDKEIAESISIYLKAEGMETVICHDGLEALDALEDKDSSGEIDLAILDIMMPGLDGVSTTVRIRENNNIPIILLTAKSEDNDKVLGLNIGADDYVTKPFSPLELVARVKSQLRRYRVLGSGEKEKPNVYTCGGVEIDDDARRVTVDGNEVSLTKSEYEILKYLMLNKGKILSSAQIYENVWDEEAYGSENVIAVHIRHIREKIEIDPREPRYLKVVWGQGYRMGEDYER